ncbi:hypothetical protein [Crateriforma conspicua]|nr:hypothetical protein [Crateriforma conspicua]
MSDQDDDRWRGGPPRLAVGLRGVWAIGSIVLLVATWRLWIPWGSPEYPMVGFVRLSWATAASISLLSTIVVLIACGWILVRPTVRGVRADSPTPEPMTAADRRWWIVAGGWIVLFVIDQHRLQPWAYQAALYALVFATMDVRRSKAWLIALASSVYLYSAAGKFDFQFAHTVGADLVTNLWATVGGDPESLPESIRPRLALALPAGELLIAIGLWTPWTRRAAGIAAMGMHGALLLVLGPLGLAHSRGVVLWNVLLIVQAWCLFVRPRWFDGPTSEEANDHADASGHRPTTDRWSGVAVRLVLVAALLMPLSERAGYWDHWLSWSLYSPHTSRLEVQFHQTATNRLPASVSRHLESDSDGDRWRTLDMSAWSLDRRGVPVYPQSRYQIALIDRLCRRHQIDDQVRGIVKSVSDRWTGQRQQTYRLGLEELSASGPRSR